MRIFFLLSVLGCLAAPSLAQTPPTIRVLGVGDVALDFAIPATEALAQGYRLYVPDTATTATPLALSSCGAPSAGAAAGTVTTCRFPLSVFTLPAAPATLRFAVTATTEAADGTLETAKVISPFVLQRAAPPVGPVATGMSVRPKLP
jgi:hypothetical protein